MHHLILDQAQGVSVLLLFSEKTLYNFPFFIFSLLMSALLFIIFLLVISCFFFFLLLFQLFKAEI